MDTQLNPMSISEIFTVLKRRKWILPTTFLLTVIPTLIYNYTATPIYRSATKIILESDQTINTSLLGGFEGSNFISNKIEEMKTVSFAQDIYSALPQEARDRFLMLAGQDGNSPESFTVWKIKNGLSFNQVQGTQILTIAYDSEDAELTSIIANKTAEVLMNRNLNVRRQRHSSVKGFIEQQFELVSQRLKVAEDALKNYKESENITSLEDESREILQRVTQAEVLFNQVGTQRKELQERLRVIQTKLDKGKQNLSKNVLKTNNPLAVKLKERLVNLEVTYSNFQVQGYPEDNPRMVELKNEIAEIKKSLVSETLKINDEGNMESLVDPFSQIREYLEESIELELDLQALTAKEGNLRKLLDQYNNKLRSLPDKEMNLVRLLRDKDANAKLYMTLLDEREKARIQEASEIGSIRILEPARTPINYITPRKTLNLLVAIFGALFLGIAATFATEFINDSVRTQDDVEKILDLPVIAVIPKIKTDIDSILAGKNGSEEFFRDENKSILFDAYSLLAFALDDVKDIATTIMVTSAVPNEGKSTVSSMLAMASAQRGKKVILVDADLRRPSLHNMFNVPREPGITNLAVEFMQRMNKLGLAAEMATSDIYPMPDENPLELTHLNDQMIRTALVSGLVPTREKNLYLLPCGFIPQNPIRIWSSTIWNRIIPQLKEIASTVIVDAPPYIGVAETTMMSRYMDSLVLCVSAGALEKKVLKRSFQLFYDSIELAEKRVIGAVLNKADFVDIYGSYKYYGYYAHNQKNRQLPEIPKTDFSS